MMNLSIILKCKKNDIEFIKEGYFDGLSLINGKLNLSKNLLSYIESEKYLDYMKNDSNIKCIISNYETYGKFKNNFKGGVILSNEPKNTFFSFHNWLYEETNFYRSNYYSNIDKSVKIDNRVIIPSKNVTIGRHSVIGKNVVINENTVIGDNVIIRDGAIIGSQAFYYYKEKGNNEPVSSTGGVIIGNYVEINNNVVISKGVLGDSTIIGEYTKIDSNVSIAHDVKISKNCLICAGVNIAGVVEIGEEVFIGVGANIVPLVSIDTKSKISAGAVVTKNVQSLSHVSGNFAVDHNKYVKHIKQINE